MRTNSYDNDDGIIMLDPDGTLIERLEDVNIVLHNLRDRIIAENAAHIKVLS